MKVILTENIPKVGKKYEIKKVAAGFGRNFLIPKGLAHLATVKEVNRIEQEKNMYEGKIKKLHKEFLIKIEKAKKTKISISAKSNEEGHLYAGLGVEDIIAVIKKEHDIELESAWIVLERPIKEIGIHNIKIKKNPFTDDNKLAKEFIDM